MTKYLRFDANGIQVESLTQDQPPKGEAWYPLPQGYDETKRHRLKAGDAIEEESEQELEQNLLIHAKEKTRAEAKTILENYRESFSGASVGKSEANAIKRRVATQVIEVIGKGGIPSALEQELLGELATLKGLDLQTMAESILQKSDQLDFALMKLETFEEQIFKLIEASLSLAELNMGLDNWKLEVANLMDPLLP